MVIAERLLKSFVILCCVFSFGCANHLMVDTQTETEVVRDKISHTIDIETNTGSLVTAALVNVKVEENQSFKVKTFESKSDYDVVTPYQGGREIFELPMGVVLLPIAVVVNVLDFVTLGLLPDKFTDVTLDWSFAGMNPFMNIESEDRTERTLIKNDKKLIDEKDEHIRKPLFNHELHVSSGDSDSMQLTLDENGKAEVSLIRLSSLSKNIEKITLEVNSGNIESKKDIDVSRQLRSQLQQASVITQKYAQLAKKDVADEDVKQIDIATFASDLISLTELGFESESLRIEKKAISLMSEEQKKIFREAMDKVLQSKVNNPATSS